VFTTPFPNTIYWNASKHNGVTKNVGLRQIQFSSNDGNETLSYCDFVTLVREVYACMIALIKMKLIFLRLSQNFKSETGSNEKLINNTDVQA